MKKLVILTALALILSACGVGVRKENDEKSVPDATVNVPQASEEALPQDSAEIAPEEEALDKPTAPLSAAEINALPNESSGWGFKKNPGAYPEFTAGQRSVMAEYECIYEGSKDEKVLYLTFDEGYENGYTEKILDTLKEKNVKAAFFITGPYLDKNFDLIKRMLDEGHIVGNHTVSHPKMPSLETAEAMQEEILALDMKFYETFGTHMTYFRPPEGVYSHRSLAAANAIGYKNVLWSFAYRDWETDKQKGSAYAIDSVVPYFANGTVMLLHAVSSDNAAALGSIIDAAVSQGFVFKSLDEFAFQS